MFVFCPNFRDLTMWIMLCVLNKSFSRHYEIFILDFISQLEVGSERYEFSKVDYQTVLCEERNQYFNGSNWHYLSLRNLTTPLMALNLLLSIWNHYTFYYPLQKHQKTHILFISIEIFSLSAQSFQCDLFCFNLLYFKFNNSNWFIIQIILV